MDIAGSVALVTGANGGIGRALVAALLKRGAAKIYVPVRDPASLSDLLKDIDGRLAPLRLDVTDSAQVTAAAAAAPVRSHFGARTEFNQNQRVSHSHRI